MGGKTVVSRPISCLYSAAPNIPKMAMAIEFQRHGAADETLVLKPGGRPPAATCRSSLLASSQACLLEVPPAMVKEAEPPVVHFQAELGNDSFLVL